MKPALRTGADRTLELLEAQVGRTLAEVRRLVPLPGLLAAGNHGLELDLGDGPTLVAEAVSWLDRIAAAGELLEDSAEAAGGFVELKGATLKVESATERVDARQLQ